MHVPAVEFLRLVSRPRAVPPHRKDSLLRQPEANVGVKRLLVRQQPSLRRQPVPQRSLRQGKQHIHRDQWTVASVDEIEQELLRAIGVGVEAQDYAAMSFDAVTANLV